MNASFKPKKTMLNSIRVRGAREHNLKNISLDLPRNKFIVVTGLSGSGKSTLAFDTIYAEGQRRYVESLSAYARQFLGLMNKPDVDSIEGLSPAISIEQKTTSKNPRSTVGTVTEIYDYLRLLFARVGTMFCPQCNSPIQPQSAENIVRLISSTQKPVTLLAPIIRGVKGNHSKVFDDLKKEGYVRVRVDGKIHRLEDFEPNLKRYEKHWIEAVIDRVEPADTSRLTEGVEAALSKGSGTIVVVNDDTLGTFKEIERSRHEKVYTSHGACPKHPDIVFEQLEPRMFSFNSPFGACQTCLGIGEKLEISEDLVAPDRSLSIIDGALKVYKSMDLKWRTQQIAAVGKKYGFDVFTPLNKFTKKQLKVLFYGTREPIDAHWRSGASMNMLNGWEGIINQTMRLYNQTESEYRKEEIEKFMVSLPCHDCKGKRLKDNMLAVKINGKSIIDVCEMSILHSKQWFDKLKLSPSKYIIAKQVLKEIKARLGFLYNVGLGYLNLARGARTLSGGEAQRIRLATQIGSNLMGVLYILDEPSIGLHQRDNLKLIQTLTHLRDIGNTLIVVEHDEETIRAADHVVDLGPGAGVHGGYICATGSVQDITSNEKSVTGQYLSGKRTINVPANVRKPKGVLRLGGCEQNNLKKINVSFPLATLCAITGVSGSGKSTLLNQTLTPALRKHFNQSAGKVGRYKILNVPDDVGGVIVIDQDPIGKTPRSNPATYTKLFDDIRKLFAQTKESKSKGYLPGRFSFNVPGGRCETCKGDGLIKIEMNFLPDVYVECEDCKGKRYNNETLQVRYKGNTIADVLDMSVERALETFANHSSLKRKLKTLNDVGLGYIKLGQSATTLSGGESQRIKLTRELAKFKKGNIIYILDEPTTGLHFDDVKKLIDVLNRLVDKGNSVYVIEHNLDVIKSCDYVIELGPEGGDDGGKIVAFGTPQEVARKKCYTGQYLKKVFKG